MVNAQIDERRVMRASRESMLRILRRRQAAELARCPKVDFLNPYKYLPPRVSAVFYK